MFCTKCGMNNPDSTVFCSGCGAAVNKGQGSAEAPKRSRVGLIMVLVSLAVIIACVSILAINFSGIFSSESIADDGTYNTPEDAVCALVEAIFDGDGEKAVKIISEKVLKNTDEYDAESFTARIDEIKDGFDEGYGKGWSYEVIDTDVVRYATEEDVSFANEQFDDMQIEEMCLVQCIVEYTYDGGKTAEEVTQVTAFKVDGKWRAVIDI